MLRIGWIWTGSKTVSGGVQSRDRAEVTLDGSGYGCEPNTGGSGDVT